MLWPVSYRTAGAGMTPQLSLAVECCNAFHLPRALTGMGRHFLGRKWYRGQEESSAKVRRWL